ncbi:MAG: alpha/beta hydrolase [Pseudomonadota bacterium]|uniref:alpha/beta fold hydrolase n=1 Tax=Novosphingobium sp. MBES04 TaxID=1206458 RepID=UPI00057DD4A3|nr:alpha/beta hydrolase [Novosphingobium sp. MBES04]MED5546785.1 alpha/beta hydrolase [Pseudomonadota bacterium]GAM05255.1 alpha/beta hydrolase fold protein [Novosphingobium sp. MBES04]
MSSNSPASPVRRGFVDVPFGQVHYREVQGTGRPLVLLHASPGSSRQLVPLIEQLGTGRRVIAPDTAGFGDSSPHPLAAPDARDFAATTLAALDALGLEEFDLYGSHTGACIAAEIAIAQPGRVAHLVLDGVGLFEGAFLESLMANYAPAFTPDLDGAYLSRAFQFLRDQCSFWPWYNRTREGRREAGIMPAPALHAWLLELLKANETYPLGYHAAFTWPVRERLPMVPVPTLMMAASDDPLAANTAELAPTLSGARYESLPAASDPAFAARRQAVVESFLG